MGQPPLLVLAAWRFWPKPRERGIAALVVGAALLFLLPPLASTVMALPVMNMKPF